MVPKKGEMANTACSALQLLVKLGCQLPEFVLRDASWVIPVYYRTENYMVSCSKKKVRIAIR